MDYIGNPKLGSTSETDPEALDSCPLVIYLMAQVRHLMLPKVTGVWYGPSNAVTKWRHVIQKFAYRSSQPSTKTCS